LRSPARMIVDNQRARAEEEAKQAQQKSLNEIPAANDILVTRGAERARIKMDVGEMIVGALPGQGIWDVKNNWAVWFTRAGKEYDGTDLSNSAMAIEGIISDTLGDPVRAIYSRAVTAPLDPSFRFQKTAEDAGIHVLSQMQKDGIIADDYSSEKIGIVSDSAAADVGAGIVQSSREMLEKGNSPDDVMIAAGVQLADSKAFTGLPDAAKEFVVRDISKKIDLMDGMVVTKTISDVSQMFNAVEQQAEMELATETKDFIVDDSMPVPPQERAALIQEVFDGVKQIQEGSRTIHSFSDPKYVLDTSWDERQKQYSAVDNELKKRKDSVSRAFRRVTRDQPKEVVDHAASALFDVQRDLIKEGLTPSKMIKQMEKGGIDLARLEKGDQRKFILGRAIDRWYVQKSKDPVKAPLYAALRAKMRKTISDGGQLDPNIESAATGLIAGLARAAADPEIERALAKEGNEELIELQNIFSSKVPIIVTKGSSPTVIPIEKLSDIDDARDYVNQKFQKYGPEIYGKAMEGVDALEIKLKTEDAQDRAAKWWRRDRPIATDKVAHDERPASASSQYLRDSRSGESVKTRGTMIRGGKTYYLTENNDVLDEYGNFVGKAARE